MSKDDEVELELPQGSPLEQKFVEYLISTKKSIYSNLEQREIRIAGYCSETGKIHKYGNFKPHKYAKMRKRIFRAVSEWSRQSSACRYCGSRISLEKRDRLQFISEIRSDVEDILSEQASEFEDSE